MLDSLKNKKIIAVLGVLLCLAMCGVFGGLCMADVQGTVYISDSGSDMSSGADASHPVKTLGTAYKKLSGGGTLIVEGKLSVKGELPNSDGKVTVKGSTSSSQLVLLGDIRLNSDTAFESITINGSSGAFHIMCAGHNVTFGDGIVTTKGSAYPAIIGGIVMTDGMNAEEATFSNYKIEINSGTYNYVYGSNRRISDKQPMGVTGDVSLVINGGSFVGTGHTADDTAVCAVGSYASQNGAYYMEINGGTFNCGVFGIARPGINANTLVAYYRGDLHMKITGGSFKGTCMGAVQNTLASYVGGNFLFEVTGGSFTSTLEHISGEGVRGRCTYAVTEQLLPFMYAFERTVFVSNAGNDKYSGATNDTAVATIARAAELLGKRGGTVVVCSRVTVPKDFTFPDYTDGIVITSKLGERDHTDTAQLTFNCYTDQDMGIETYPDIVSGARITKSTLKLFTQKPASVTVNGGTWNSVTFGSVRAEGGRATLHTVKGDGKISIGGGTFRGIVKLSGMSSMEGSLSAEISGGSFLCPVYVIASPVTVDSDVSSIIGDISLKITGGDFHSDIDFAQNDNRNTFNGKYTLTIEGGDLRCVGEIIGADGIEGENSSTLRVSESFNYDGKSEGTVKFKNPVVIGAADPSIYYYNGYYYYTKAGYYNGKPAVISSRAANLSDIGCAVEYVLWYEDGEEKINSLWAPQLYFLEGQAYIYASCAVDGSTRRFPYVWKCTNPNNILDGKAEMLGRVGKYDKQMDSWLSPRLMEYKGQLYYISAVFASASDRVSTNYKERMIIAKMESPISFAEEKVHIIANPDKEWERFDIMEGAFALTAPDGTLYISYAANYTDKNDYCTGVLELVGDNLLSPSSWKKHELPIQEREPGSGIYGPGATVYINAPDGETWAAYHIKTHADNKYACRHIVLQKLEWENGHTPVLGYPDGLWEIHEMEVNPMSVAERVQGFGTFERIAAAGIPEENSGGFRVNVAALIITAGIAAALGACICVMLCIPKKKKEKEN